jgi:hypothetical protein
MPQIKLSITVAAAREKVFPLIATPRGLSEWWAADVTEKNDVVDLGFFKRATIYRLCLITNNPPHDAQWLCLSGHEWADTRLRFALTPVKDKTRVLFTHADWEAETDYFTDCTTTWGGLMFRLRAAAEGKGSGPLFTADGQAY